MRRHEKEAMTVSAIRMVSAIRIMASSHWLMRALDGTLSTVLKLQMSQIVSGW